MVNVSILIENDLSKSKTQTFIEPISASFEGETLKKAIGTAMLHCARTMNSQYDAPKVTIAGVLLNDAQAKKFKMNFWDFQVEFANIRESILAQTAFESEESKVAYIRETDRIGMFKNQTKFTNQQVAAQAKEQLRLVRDLTRWVKEDAKKSVVPPEVEERRQLMAEVAKQKRIAAKAAAQLA